MKSKKEKEVQEAPMAVDVLRGHFGTTALHELVTTSRDAGRRKLIRLYAGKLEISGDLADLLVRKTKGSSAAFIKELMRRSAQFLAQAGDSRTLDAVQVEEALDEMLFAGGTLNVKLLGGAASPDGI